MKKKILIFIIPIFTLVLCYCICEIVAFANGMRQDKVGVLNWQIDITGIYYVELPEGLDTIEFSATVSFDKTKKIHKLKLPNGGTGTNVFIYDSNYLETIRNNTIVKIEPLIQGGFNQNQEVLLDITNLTNGKYYVHYLSCNLGGVFPLYLK